MAARLLARPASRLRARARALYLHAAGATAPGPRGNLLLGTLPDLLRRGFFSILVDGWRTYGDLVCFRMGSRLVYLIVRPEHVAHVLIKNRDNYTKRSHRARPLVGDGLVASTGELWKRQRRLLQPHFTMQSVRDLSPGMSEAASRIADRWERHADRGDMVDIAHEMSFFALDTICRTITGTEAPEDVHGLRTAIDDAVGFVSTKSQVFRWPLALPTATNQRFKRALAVIDAFVHGAIADRRASAAHGSDLLSALLRASRQQGGAAMSPQLLRDEIVTLFLAGHETTARALAWTWYLLARHPEAEAAVHAELDTVLGGRAATAADAPRLQTLEYSFQEAMRLYPPIWVFPREASADDTLGGHSIPAGSTIMVSPYLTHRHPEFWDEPEQFQPHRFAPTSMSQRPHQGAYYPFGLGPRACIGAQLALLEATIVLSTLMQRFQLRLAADGVVEPDFGSMLQPRGGLWMTIHRRHHAQARAGARRADLPAIAHGLAQPA
jgi:cytochrome P450